MWMILQRFHVMITRLVQQFFFHSCTQYRKFVHNTYIYISLFICCQFYCSVIKTKYNNAQMSVCKSLYNRSKHLVATTVTHSHKWLHNQCSYTSSQTKICSVIPKQQDIVRSARSLNLTTLRLSTVQLNTFRYRSNFVLVKRKI